MEPSAARAAETVNGMAGFIERAVDVIRAAHMDLCIFSHALDRRAYGGEAVVTAVRAFALSHQRARVRVIVHSPSMSGGHPLVELGRLLSSRIEFRQLPEERLTLTGEYLLADERSVLSKESFDQLEAHYHADAPLEARQRRRAFDGLWEECVPAREYSVLGI